MFYDAAVNRLYITDPATGAALGVFAPGTDHVITTAHGSLDCSKTTVSLSGNTLTVNWAVSAAPILSGQNVLNGRAVAYGGGDSGYQRPSNATWHINLPPVINSVT